MFHCLTTQTTQQQQEVVLPKRKSSRDTSTVEPAQRQPCVADSDITLLRTLSDGDLPLLQRLFLQNGVPNQEGTFNSRHLSATCSEDPLRLLANELDDLDTSFMNEITISSLPPEVMVLLFSFLPAKDVLLNVRLVCRFWRSLTEVEQLWKNICEREFDIHWTEEQIRTSSYRWSTYYKELSYCKEDLALSYHDEQKKELGCEHYRRNNKIQAPCCGRFYVCRHCHNANADHPIDRYAVKVMYCMICRTVQPKGRYCLSAKCNGRNLARYYCNICNFWDNCENKSVFHCNDCNVCYLGLGLGIDYYHCNECNMCFDLRFRSSHRHISPATTASAFAPASPSALTPTPTPTPTPTLTPIPSPTMTTNYVGGTSSGGVSASPTITHMSLLHLVGTPSFHNQDSSSGSSSNTPAFLPSTPTQIPTQTLSQGNSQLPQAQSQINGQGQLWQAQCQRHGQGRGQGQHTNGEKTQNGTESEGSGCSCSGSGSRSGDSGGGGNGIVGRRRITYPQEDENEDDDGDEEGWY